MWGKYAQCKDCDVIVTHEQFSSPFFVPNCPRCGADHNFKIVTARLVREVKWYNPLTWLNEKWEVKE